MVLKMSLLLFKPGNVDHAPKIIMQMVFSYEICFNSMRIVYMPMKWDTVSPNFQNGCIKWTY